MTEDTDLMVDLELLRREWGHGYVIWFQAGVYCAARRDDAAICRRVKAEDLRREIDADHQARPVLG